MKADLAPMAVMAHAGTWRARVAAWAGHSGSRIGAFWRWWSAALLDWLPVSVRDRFGLWPQRLLLRVEEQSLVLSVLRGKIHGADTLPLQMADMLAAPMVADPLDRHLPAALLDVPRWLLLPTSAVLRRRLRLPAAAVKHLHEVTGFEIDRQTPFASADVVHAARRLGPCADGQIEVELVVLTRTALEAALAGLGPLAAKLSGIDVLDAEAMPLGINLLPAARQQRRRGLAGRTRWAVLALVSGVLVAALWQMLDNRRAAVRELEQAIATRTEAAREVAHEERQVLDLVEGSAFLQAERARRPGMLEVLDDLARRLPDGTYLEKLSIEGGRIILIGLSADAPALVGRLQDSSLWHSPALVGVVQSDAATRLDRFTLMAELKTTSAGTEGA